MANPVFTRNKEFSGQPVGFDVSAPGIPTDRMSYEGTILKSTGYFALAVITAGLVGSFAPGLAFPLGIGAFALSIIVALTRTQNPVLMGITLAAYGGLAGGLTAILEANVRYQGIAMQAVLATAAVFTAVLVLYRSGKLRTSPKLNRFFAIAFVGYFIFSIVNLGMMWFGDLPGFGIRSMDIGSTGIPWGVPIGIFAVLLASYMLLRDFEFIDNGVATGAPARLEWVAAYGLVFTLIWLYVEFLRLLAILRGR